jgi:L-rhamnose isomerase
MITINFDKAKDITKDRLRTERKPLLESLDVVMLRNLNNPTTLAEIESKKQALRDATNQVDTMTTLDELKAASLPVLE